MLIKYITFLAFGSEAYDYRYNRYRTTPRPHGDICEKVYEEIEGDHIAPIFDLIGRVKNTPHKTLYKIVNGIFRLNYQRPRSIFVLWNTKLIRKMLT